MFLDLDIFLIFYPTQSANVRPYFVFLYHLMILFSFHSFDWIAIQSDVSIIEDRRTNVYHRDIFKIKIEIDDTEALQYKFIFRD